MEKEIELYVDNLAKVQWEVEYQIFDSFTLPFKKNIWLSS